MTRNPYPTIDSCHHLEVLRLHKYRWTHHLAQRPETMPPLRLKVQQASMASQRLDSRNFLWSYHFPSCTVSLKNRVRIDRNCFKIAPGFNDHAFNLLHAIDCYRLFSLNSCWILTFASKLRTSHITPIVGAKRLFQCTSQPQRLGFLGSRKSHVLSPPESYCFLLQVDGKLHVTERHDMYIYNYIYIHI